MCEFLNILAKYQTIIVGFIGFVGVIITLLVNSKIGRDQHENKIRHERNSIRQAILTELESLKETFESRAEKEKDDQDWLIPNEVTTNVYNVLLPNIGILTISEIKLVMRAYLLVNEAPKRLSLLASNSLESIPAGYMQVENKHLDKVRSLHEVFLKNINDAIKVLNKNLEID